MKYIFNFILSLLLLYIPSSCSEKNIYFNTDNFKVTLDSSGKLVELSDNNGKNYLSSKENSYLLSIRVNNEFEIPNKCIWNPQDSIITLSFAKNNAELEISVKSKEQHFVFEVEKVKSDNNIDLIIWGPYSTTISESIGECIGVVHDNNFAIGIQALNPKTIGGYPTTEDDVDPSFDIFATSSLVDVSDSVKILYRGQTAKHIESGSCLQAYCRNRDKVRIIPMWGHDKYTAPAYDDGGIVGSKIALFGTMADKVLDNIGRIEKEENLPHPMMDGIWMKQNILSTQSYIIYPFNEKNIDKAIEFTKKTGFKFLYNGGPFKTWGNFILNKDEFPNGLDGLKKCVEKAAKSNIKLGIHTLSNFITTNDPYVTPIPDKRLALVGSTVLSSNIDKSQTNIPIDDPSFFNQMKNNSLHGVLVGEELIRYEKVSEKAPWKLLNCQRGAYNTIAKSHSVNDTISKLLDHGYKTFLTNIDLTKEVARNIAKIFNYTGIQQISFDGLEGAWSTGLGQYGLSLMIKEWYDALNPEYKNCINDASMTTHYNWHTFTRMNWGEPWYAGFRESQMNYRLMNQDFYRRNFMPCMLGWFQLSSNTSIEDIEWLLARSAAFDAGYTLVTNGDAIKENGNSDKIINSIRIWEDARLKGAFPKELKKEMESVNNEYTLKEISSNKWLLNKYLLKRFKHENIIKQPGEPVCSKWIFNNIYESQPLKFIISSDVSIKNIKIEIGNFSTLEIKENLNAGEYMKYDGGEDLVIYDKNWNQIKRIKIDKERIEVSKGDNSIIFTCDFTKSNLKKGEVSLEMKTIGSPIEIKSKI